MSALAHEHDCLLLDLDGTVFRGHEATVGAVDTLATIRARTLYVTNNASREPAEVAQHLQALGFAAAPEDVVTSAQSAAQLLAGQLPPGAIILVGRHRSAGHRGQAGRPQTRSAVVRCAGRRRPRSLTTDQLAGSRRSGVGDPGRRTVGGGQCRPDAAVRAGPATRQRSHGGGAARGDRSRTASGRQAHRPCSPTRWPRYVPDSARGGRSAGHGHRRANTAGLPSLLVLTGVSTADDVVRADASQRPGYLAVDLRSLRAPTDTLRIGPQPAWRIDIGSSAVTVHFTGRDPATHCRWSVLLPMRCGTPTRRPGVDPGRR